MEIRINEVIRSKRKQADISQEIFAEAMGVSVQAVSKWETGMSFPDITMLPKIAEYFSISIDELFFGEGTSAGYGGIPDDGKLRIVQFLGGKMLSREEYDRNARIMLELPETNGRELNVEIWGDADIDGDIIGSVTAGGSISCDDIGQSANAGNSITCGDVGQSANAGDSISCGDVGQSANAGDSISCGDVGMNANAGDNINCGDIGRDANAGDDINCGDITGNAEATNGNIRCHIINGDAKCGGDIIYENN